MLNLPTLQKQIQQAFEEVLPGALERGMLAMMPEKSDDGDKKSKNFAKVVTELVAEDLGQRIGSAIDYYIKNANVYGTIITVGSPFTQTAVIQSPSPITNGKVPNSFGII